MNGLALLGKLDPSAWARYGTYAFMLSMPWATVFLGSMSPHDGARIFQTLVMCLAAWAWVDLGAPWRPQRAVSRYLLLALVAGAGASVLAAPGLQHAALEASATVLLVLLALVFARTPLPTLRVELPPVLALSALLSLLMELPRVAFRYADGLVPAAGDFGFMYMNHRFLNHVESILLPLLLLPLLLPAARWVRVATWIGLAGGLALLWRTGGRGTLIAFTVFVLALPWLLKAQARQILRTMAVAFAWSAAIYLLLFVLPIHLLGLQNTATGSAAQRLTSVNDAARLYLWKLAWQDIVEHPWLGVGPMHYAHLKNPMAAHPHNSVLQWASEWGVAVTAVLTVLLAGLFVRRIDQTRSQPVGSLARVFTAVCLLTAVVGCIDSLVSGTLVMPVSQTWWFVAAGCALATADAGPSNEPARPMRAHRAGLALALALVAGHLLLSAATFVQATRPGSDVPVGMIPRYWNNGQF